MTMPNFLIIGSAKSGTTALYHYLKQHPQVFMSPIKEPCFFVLEGERLDFRAPDGTWAIINGYGINDIASYRRLFKKVKDEKAIGEASVWYLGAARAAERIHHHIPHAKLIAILRSPIDVAYSAYLMARRNGVEPCSDFSDALKDQERRLQSKCFGGNYVQPGFYHRHLTRYFSRFGPAQIRAYLYDDFSADSKGLIKDIFRFLDVDDAFVPDMSIRDNVSGLPKNKLVHRLLTRRGNPFGHYLTPFLPHGMRRLLINLKNRNLVKPPLSSELREELIEVFREDILKLQDLVDRDLSQWLE